MAKTRIDIINSALKILGAVNRGFSAKAFDVELVGDIYDGLHDRLRIRNKIYWSNADCVPNESFGPMSAVLAGTVLAEGNNYGLSTERRVEIRGLHDKGFNDINEVKIAGIIPNAEPTPANYF